MLESQTFIAVHPENQVTGQPCCTTGESANIRESGNLPYLRRKFKKHQWPSRGAWNLSTQAAGEARHLEEGALNWEPSFPVIVYIHTENVYASRDSDSGLCPGSLAGENLGHQ